MNLESVIDLSRGVTKRTHAGVGLQVSMYKDDPGRYYDNNGNEMSKEFAREAGFDVDFLEKEKEKFAKLKKARIEIERQYEEVQGEVVESSKEYEVVCHSERKNQYNVVKKGSDKPLNNEYMGKAKAKAYAESLKGSSTGE